MLSTLSKWDHIYLPLWKEMSEKVSNFGKDEKNIVNFFKSHSLDVKDGQISLKERCVKLDEGDLKQEEAKLIFKALFALSKDCYVEAVDYPFIKAQAIYMFLARPYIKCVEACGSVEAINVSLKAKAQFHQFLFKINCPKEKIEKLIFNIKSITEKKAIAIIKIQRFFRKKYYYQPSIPRTPFQVKAQFERSKYLHRLDFNPLFPISSAAVIPEKAQEWILAHDGKWQPLAKKFIQSLRHVSFKKFLLRLKVSIEDFNAKLASLPPSERKYHLILPSSKPGKSNYWVSSLALKYLSVFPEKILSLEEAQANNGSKKEIALFVDDAAYSGKQMEQFISSLSKDYSIHLIAPYMTKSAFQRFSFSGAWISKFDRMLSIEELKIFSEEELAILKEHTGSYDHGILTNRTLTWFDHKIADHLSTLDIILAQGKLLVPSDRDKYTSGIKFIPDVIPPYKQPSSKPKEDSCCIS